MAQSLHRVRELIGADLDDQVGRISREMDMQADVIAQGPHMDNKRARGLPAVGRVSGVITDSFVPGSDEHLDELDAA